MTRTFGTALSGLGVPAKPMVTDSETVAILEHSAMSLDPLPTMQGAAGMMPCRCRRWPCWVIESVRIIVLP